MTPFRFCVFLILVVGSIEAATMEHDFDTLVERVNTLEKEVETTRNDNKQLKPEVQLLRKNGQMTPQLTDLCLRFSVTKDSNDYDGSFFFLVDEERYAYKDAFIGVNNFAPSGSATINIELTAGQIVRIENAVSTAIYGTDSSGFMFSWFTGHLLYAL